MTVNNSLHRSLRSSVEKISLHSHFIPVSRASWSLFALLMIKKKSKKQYIAMPSFICQSMVAAVKLAGWNIRFLDIDCNNGMVEFEKYCSVINDKLDAILFVHLLGNYNFLGNLQKKCAESNVLLIEDSAQFYPPVSCFQSEDLSQVRLISFGSTKLVDADGGALILSDDESLLSEINLFQKNFKFKDLPSIKNDLALFNKKFYSLKSQLSSNDNLHKLFQDILRFYLPAISLEINFTDLLIKKISDGVAQLPDLIKIRQDNMKQYENYLQDLPLKSLSTRHSIPWRASFRIDGLDYAKQHNLSDHLRNHGFDVSNWYLPAHWYIENASKNDAVLPNTLKLSMEIIQFWVDKKYNKTHFLTLREELKELIHVN